MNVLITGDRGIVLKFFDYLRRHGPLGTAKRVCEVMQGRSNRVPGCRRLFRSIDRLLCMVQHYFDSSFDRKYGTDTSGVIPLQKLTIKSENTDGCLWYEAISVKVFMQIMNCLNIDFGKFKFIDLGSGKGRVLLLASDHGFKRVIGVEFAQELHHTANKNVEIYERYTRKPSNIETICMDATEFPIPEGPVVIFFYSPFIGRVMEKILNNVSKSFAATPRKIVLVFCGRNTESIELLRATGFECRELEIRSDWSRFIQYQALLFTSPQ